jgi:hypothetical protein
MPDDRLFHKRLGHSAKVNQLSDVEEIVWRTYVQAADDFGVMRFAAAALKEAHDRLAKRADGSVLRMLRRAIDVGLLLTFEHQCQIYCYQADWQDFQKIRYPLRTIHPPIPPELLDHCTAATRWLFTAWPGGKKKLPTWQPPEGGSGDDEIVSGKNDDFSGKIGDFSGRSRASAGAGGDRNAPSPFGRTDPSPFGGTRPEQVPEPELEPELNPADERGALPLVGLARSQARPGDHPRCYLPCDRICISAKQHRIFLARFGGDRAAAVRELEAFYARVRANLPPIGFSDKPWGFWDAHFAVAFPSIAPGARVATVGASKQTAANVITGQHWSKRKS